MRSSSSLSLEELSAHGACRDDAQPRTSCVDILEGTGSLHISYFVSRSVANPSDGSAAHVFIHGVAIVRAMWLRP